MRRRMALALLLGMVGFSALMKCEPVKAKALMVPHCNIASVDPQPPYGELQNVSIWLYYNLCGQADLNDNVQIVTVVQSWIDGGWFTEPGCGSTLDLMPPVANAGIVYPTFMTPLLPKALNSMNCKVWCELSYIDDVTGARNTIYSDAEFFTVNR